MLGPFFIKETKEASLIEVTLPPDKINWDFIDLYKDRVEILLKNLEDLDLQRISIHFSKNEKDFYLGKLKDLPNEFRLKGLYLDFRPFLLNKRKGEIGVQKFCHYLSTLTNSVSYHNYINSEKEKFNSSFIFEGWLKFNGKNVLARKIIETWFYSYYFHFNEIKELNKYLKYFDNDTFQSLLFYSVYESIKIIKNINWSVSVLSPDNLFFKIPKSFSNH